MRLKHAVIGAAAATALVGCNAQPALYEIAIDPTPLNSLVATCYVNDTLPAERVAQATGIFAGTEWQIWDGPENQYLDTGENELALGDAQPVVLGALIEGEGDVFTGSEQRVSIDNTITPPVSRVRTQVIKVTFESRGNTAEGDLQITSNFECQGCDPAERNVEGNKSCSATLPFVGRRIDYDREQLSF